MGFLSKLYENVRVNNTVVDHVNSNEIYNTTAQTIGSGNEDISANNSTITDTVDAGTVTTGSLTIGGESVAGKVIESKSLSGVSSADFTTGIDSDHDTYVFKLSNVTPATDNVALQIQVSTDGGSNWKSGASDYAYVSGWFNDDGATGNNNSTGDSKIVLTGGSSVGSASGETLGTGTIQFSQPDDGTYTQYFEWSAAYHGNGTQAFHEDGKGEYLTAEAIDGIRFQFGSGNIEDGVITLLGVN